MSISFIVAIAQNNAIGCENKLLWHIPNDLKRFKKLTLGHTVIMGRSTYDSLPLKPLPGRKNIVMTRDMQKEFHGCITTHSVEETIQMLEADKEHFVIGGAQIYEAFMPHVDKLILTIVHKDFVADTYFPIIDFSEWQEVYREDVVDTCNLGFDYSFIDYIKK